MVVNKTKKKEKHMWSFGVLIKLGGRGFSGSFLCLKTFFGTLLH